MVESALVTWVGLLLLGIANVAPHGHITVNILRPPTPPSFADIDADAYGYRLHNDEHHPGLLCEYHI